MADVTFFSDQINLFDFSPYLYEKLPENLTIPPPSLILPNPPFFDAQSPLIFQSNSDQGFHSPTSSDERSTVSDSGTYGLPPKRRAGRLKFRETRHPFFRGVRSRNGGKWVCEVREPHKKTRIWLGTYPTAEMAARAHDVAAIALRGPTALLNFPDSLWKLPMPESIAPSEIRRTAVEAAEKFRPRTKSGVIGVSGDCEVVKCETGSNWGEEIDVKSVKSPENLFLFEDEVFTQDQLFDEMAHAMLLSPPHWGTQEGEELGVGVVDNMGLWTYSI